MHALIVVTNADLLAPGHPTGLWLEEFAVPFLALCEAGVEVTVASPRGGPAPIDPKSAPDDAARERWREPLARLQTTTPLAEVSQSGFDALFLPGGHGPMVDLAGSRALRDLVGAFHREGTIIAAICHRPAGLLAAQE